MADKRVTVTIEAIDKASAVFKDLNKNISNLGKQELILILALVS